MRAPYRTKFDPDRAFTVRRETVINGVKYYPGDPVVTEGIAARRLRVMHSTRVLVYPGEAPGAILTPEQAASTHAGRKAAWRAAKAAARKGPPADPHPDRTAITIPDDWAAIAWPQRLSLAASVAPEGVKVKGAAAVAEVITAELERRAGLA